MNAKSALILTLMMTFATSSFASFLPEDFVPRRMSLKDEVQNDMTEEEFNTILDKIEGIYKPIVADLGRKLKVKRKWKDDTVNAYAKQFFRSWSIFMFGGLARHRLMTGDGFAMVACHEIGHHIAGFPMYPRRISIFGGKASNEGQSDYFAAQVCAPGIWQDELEVNASFREDINPLVQEQCDSVYKDEARQNLCYRISAAGLSLSRTLADMSGTTEPNYETPNPTVVLRTYHKHPEAQCRLDTTLAAALCSAKFDNLSIPGKKANGLAVAEREAADNSCMRIDSYEVGLRPLCWFKPNLELDPVDPDPFDPFEPIDPTDPLNPLDPGLDPDFDPDFIPGRI